MRILSTVSSRPWCLNEAYLTGLFELSTHLNVHESFLVPVLQFMSNKKYFSGLFMCLGYQLPHGAPRTGEAEDCAHTPPHGKDSSKLPTHHISEMNIMTYLVQYYRVLLFDVRSSMMSTV
jgi:hypothetical protein